MERQMRRRIAGMVLALVTVPATAVPAVAQAGATGREERAG
jgi:hypothetical protein